MPHKRKQMEKCESHYLPCLHDDSGERDRLKYYDMFHSRQADYLSGESGYPLYGHTETEYLSPVKKYLKKCFQSLKQPKNIFIWNFLFWRRALCGTPYTKY